MPRKPTKKAIKDGLKIGHEVLVIELQNLEQRAHRLGLTITARGINNAVNASGWEMAGETNRADMATRGER